jgi:hypothetical protein
MMGATNVLVTQWNKLGVCVMSEDHSGESDFHRLWRVAFVCITRGVKTWEIQVAGK